MLLLLYTIHILYILLYMSQYNISAAGSDASVVRRTQARLQAQQYIYICIYIYNDT